jgi:hypothetical protein
MILSSKRVGRGFIVYDISDFLLLRIVIVCNDNHSQLRIVSQAVCKKNIVQFKKNPKDQKF